MSTKYGGKYLDVNNEETIQINRKLAKYKGLPSESIMLADNKVKYDAGNKLWICMICNITKINIGERTNDKSCKFTPW